MSPPSNTFVLAIDAGVSNVKVGLVDRQGRIHHYVVQTTNPEQGAAGVAGILAETCRQSLQRSGLQVGDLEAIGCCTPGCVDPATGVIVASATPGWLGIDVRQPLEKAFGRQVSVDGDGAAAVQAAHAFGPTRGQNNLLAITIGTGISCGFMVGGEVLRGAGQAALEAGHMPLFWQGRPCSCGLRGCWEAHAGGGALRRLLQEYRAAGHQLPAEPEQLAELAEASHEVARQIWEEQGMLFGLGLAVLLNVLNPRTVVLGGGLLKSWNLFKKQLLKTAREKSLARNSEAAIVCAPDPERLALLGAAVAAVRQQELGDFFVDAGGGAP